MINKSTMMQWITEALQELGGSATLLDVLKKVWEQHNSEIATSGDTFYTWQYDIRWAATLLRKEGKLKAADDSPRGIWELG